MPGFASKIYISLFIRATWLLVPVVLLPVTPARPCSLCTPLHAVAWNQLRIKMLSLALKGIRTVRCLVEDTYRVVKRGSLNILTENN